MAGCSNAVHPDKGACTSGVVSTIEDPAFDYRAKGVENVPQVLHIKLCMRPVPIAVIRSEDWKLHSCAKEPEGFVPEVITYGGRAVSFMQVLKLTPTCGPEADRSGSLDVILPGSRRASDELLHNARCITTQEWHRIEEKGTCLFRPVRRQLSYVYVVARLLLSVCASCVQEDTTLPSTGLKFQ